MDFIERTKEQLLYRLLRYKPIQFSVYPYFIHNKGNIFRIQNIEEGNTPMFSNDRMYKITYNKPSYHGKHEIELPRSYVIDNLYDEKAVKLAFPEHFI